MARMASWSWERAPHRKHVSVESRRPNAAKSLHVRQPAFPAKGNGEGDAAVPLPTPVRPTVDMVSGREVCHLPYRVRGKG